MALMNQAMFLKFILFNQDMFQMNHYPKGGSRILKWGVNFCHDNVREIKYYFNI